MKRGCFETVIISEIVDNLYGFRHGRLFFVRIMNTLFKVLVWDVNSMEARKKFSFRFSDKLYFRYYHRGFRHRITDLPQHRL